MFDGLLQPTHLLLILAIVLIIFGPGKLTEVGRALGQSVRELRENAAGPAASTTPQPTPPAPPAAAEPTTTDPRSQTS